MKVFWIWLLSLLLFLVKSDDIYKFDGMSKEGWIKLAQCQAVSIPKCNKQGLHGFSLDGYSVVDYKRKILMEFTPKADCTAAVVAFFTAMGFRYGTDYRGW
jgi:hypothetical protein